MTKKKGRTVYVWQLHMLWRHRKRLVVTGHIWAGLVATVTIAAFASLRRCAIIISSGVACGGLQLDDGSNRAYSLKQGGNVIGRGQDADFRLPDTGVSRRHLEITWDGQSATLADIGSTNGTTVNGTPVQTWQLADGDVIRVGHSSLVFRTQG
jgi:hypothetical protein